MDSLVGTLVIDVGPAVVFGVEAVEVPGPSDSCFGASVVPLVRPAAEDGARV